MSTKEAYQKKIEAQVKEWEAKIDVLKARMAKADAEQRIRYEKQIETLRTKRQNLRDKFNKLKDSGETAWEELKSGVETAWKDLKNAVERAENEFSSHKK